MTKLAFWFSAILQQKRNDLIYDAFTRFVPKANVSSVEYDGLEEDFWI